LFCQIVSHCKPVHFYNNFRKEGWLLITPTTLQFSVLNCGENYRLKSFFFKLEPFEWVNAISFESSGLFIELVSGSPRLLGLIHGDISFSSALKAADKILGT